MHIYNLPFPIRDYVNDCKLILDSSGRVVMGMIDVAKEKNSWMLQEQESTFNKLFIKVLDAIFLTLHGISGSR